MSGFANAAGPGPFGFSDAPVVDGDRDRAGRRVRHGQRTPRRAPCSREWQTSPHAATIVARPGAYSVIEAGILLTPPLAAAGGSDLVPDEPASALDASVGLEIQTTLTVSGSRPSIRASMVSPRTTGPTPAGVPERMMSPAASAK